MYSVKVTLPEGVVELPVTVTVSVADVPLTDGVVDTVAEHDATTNVELDPVNDE